MTTSRTVLVVLGVLLCGVLGSVTDAPAADRPAELYQTASQQFWDGRYDQALKTYRRIVKGYPDHELYWDAQFGVARSYFEKGEMSRAAEVFRRVQQNHPEKNVRGDALFSLVEVAILRDEIIKARNLLRTFLEVYDDHPIHGTARRQLSLLEDAPTATPAPVESTEGRPASPGSGQPPRLKSPEDGERPEALPTTDAPPQDTRPVSPPPMRDAGGTSPVDQAVPSTPVDTHPAVSNDTKTIVGDTSASDRINPVDLLPEPSDTKPETGTDTPAPGELPPESPDDTSADVPSDTAGTWSGEDTGVKPTQKTPLVDASRSDSPSPDVLRQRVENRLEEGSPSDAYQALKQLTRRDDARPGDYYRAAELSHRLGNPVTTSLEYLNKATALSPNTPGRHLLLKAELLLEDDRREEVASLLATYFSDYYEDAGASQKARYHFLKGELHRARNQTDEAFFQYMSVLQSAPDSRWGQRAQTTLDNQY